MKKLLLSSAVAVIGITGVNAQNANTEAVQIGVRAGLNISHFNNGELPSGTETKSRTGFHVGLFSAFPVAPKFSVQPEVIYSEEGAELESNFNGVNTTADMKLQYINVPVLAKYYIADGFNVQAGPQISFLTGAKIKGDGEDIDIKDDLKGIDFGILIGAGYKMPMGLTIDARYNLGLTNIYDENVEGMDDFLLKNGVFQVGLGFQF